MNRFPVTLVPGSAALLWMAFAALPSAAQGGGGPSALPATGTVLHASGAPVHHHLDYDSGVFTPSPVPPGAQAISAVCFDNSFDDDIIIDALLYPPGHELVDWGVKLCGESWYVDRITIGYASVAPAAVGGDLTIRLYEDTLGWGHPGTLRKELTLTGLPSQPSPAVFPRYVTIDLGSESFYWPDGPIGWSYENHDGLTAPLLVDATIQNGVQNFFDVYTPGPATAASYDDTYYLPASGSSPGFESSFFVQIAQNSVVPLAIPIQGGFLNDLNPNVFVSQTLPWIDWTWSAEVDVSSFPGSNITVAFVSAQRVFGTFLAAGELIADPSFIDGRFSMLPQGQPHNFPIPNDPALLGREFYAQGGFLSALVGPKLTNGYELTIGSY
ncbi:MAG: hypothetical protein WD226_08600 [Planctomycetota bacterium]